MGIGLDNTNVGKGEMSAKTCCIWVLLILTDKKIPI